MSMLDVYPPAQALPDEAEKRLRRPDIAAAESANG
jgi:hypothetical protein